MVEIGPEVAIKEHATTPAGIKAQTKLARRFLTGQEIDTGKAHRRVERVYRDVIGETSIEAANEMAEIIGFSDETLDGIKSAKKTQLVGEDKGKFLKYIQYAYGVNEYKDTLEKSDDPLHKSYVTRLEDVLQTLDDDTEINIHGPVVEWRYKNAKSEAFIKETTKMGDEFGVSQNLILRRPNEPINGNKKFEYVTFNVLPKEKLIDDGENVEIHENWHAINAFRRNTWSNVRSNDPADSLAPFDYPDIDIDELKGSTFTKRLEAYFFETEPFLSAIKQLKEDTKDAFIPFAEVDPDMLGSVNEGDDPFTVQHEKLLGDFYTVQDELSARIAGYTLQEPTVPITENLKKDIVSNILYGYTEFKRDMYTEQDQFATKDADGRWDVDSNKVEKYFQDPTRKFMPSAAHIHDETFLPDAQKVIDFYYNPGGLGYVAREAVKKGLGTSIDAFTKLAQHRGDPLSALTELSLLPISHWDMYAKRKMSDQTA